MTALGTDVGFLHLHFRSGLLSQRDGCVHARRAQVPEVPPG